MGKPGTLARGRRRRWAGLAAARELPLRGVLLPLARRRRAALTGVTFVAVTCSFGKTTTKELIADCLATAGPTTRSRLSLNSAWQLAKTLLRTGPRHAYCVVELGTAVAGLLGQRSRFLRPHVAVVTGVGPVHLEGLGSEEAVASEKAAVFEGLRPGGTAVLPLDDAHFPLLRAAVPPGVRVVTAAMEREADYRLAEHDPASGAVRMEDRAAGRTVAFRLPQPGRAFAVNALLAAAVARTCGVEWDGVVAAIERFPGLPMRWERKTLRGITVINDAYNANPVSMRASLDAFAARSQGGAKWVVLGGMLELGDRELAEHRALGEYAARGPWAGLVAVGRLGETIAEAARRAGFPPSQLVCCADAAAAARILGERLRPGDAVLLKASRAVRLERIVRGLS